MNRQRLSNVLVGSAAGLLIISGGLHLMPYAQISTLAHNSGSPDIQVLLPMLWLAFGVTVIVTGVIVGVVALENSSGGKYVIAAAALVPWSGAILQVMFVGAGALGPTLLLVLDGIAVVVASYYREGRRRRSSSM